MLEIYADYQCPACIWYNKNIVAPVIVKEFVDTNKLTLSYKQFPLQMHQNARGDALAALCAHAEGKFKEYKEWIYSLEEKKRGDDVSDAERIELAKTLGLNETTFTQCLKEQHYAKKIDADMMDGNKAGLQGTPTFILDGKMVDNKVFQDPASTRQFLQNVLK